MQHNEMYRVILPAVDTFEVVSGGKVTPIIHLALPGAKDNRIYIILMVNIA
jgi:hypothetical protein